MAELLLELFSEEIPARMQAGAAESLEKLVTEGLKKEGLTATAARTYATPRRVTLVLDGLPTSQPDVSEERKGPKVDAPEQALQGFLKANGITLDQCERRETPKGTFLYHTIEKKGRPTAEVLAEVITAALAAFPWPKSMRWADQPQRWVRPLHGIVCLFEGAVVPVSFAGVESGNQTWGHRFLNPEALTVTNAADYVEKLRAAHVIVDPQDRAEIIATRAAELAAAEGLTVKDDIGLLREVAGLVEWPVPLLGRIDDAFMEVPAEVLSTSMKAHQKYFSLLKADGSLAPRFVVVSNMEPTDGGAQIVAGNERVLRARLSDARFFWDQDRKARLDSRVGSLASRTFYQGLGSVGDKVARIETLAEGLAPLVGADPALARRAAHLAKADLSTGMVGEFPELQGIMGRYYARHDGEADAVAEAIAAHYSPQGPGDACPAAPVSVAVALADKVDTLAGFWSINEKPTGSKDPFALRRAALGVIRLVLENGLRLGLLEVFAKGLAPFAAKDDTATDLLGFFADRLKVQQREQGVRHDLIEAVFVLGTKDGGTEDDLVRLLKRVEALGAFLNTEEGANLLAAYRRAMNIVRIEEKKDKRSHGGPADPAHFAQSEETALHGALETAAGEVEQAVTAEDFAAAMAALARLRGPVDAFFDGVMVNADTPTLRENRLRLLSAIGGVMGAVADFSKIEG